MKKSIYLFALVLMTSAFSFAQGTPKIGISGGLLNSNVNFDFTLSSLNATNNTGFYIGLAADIPATDKFHLQPELLYGSAGDLGYVLLPVMAKFYVAGPFHLQAGPQFSFSTTLDDIKNTVGSAIELIDSDYDGSIEDTFKTVGVDFGFGAGFDATDQLTVQARYSFEMTNRYDGPGSGLLTLRAQQLTVGLVYFF